MKRCFIACAFIAVSLPPNALYYESINTTNGTVLKQTLHNIIDDHNKYPYTSGQTDTWDVLSLADEDPSNPDYIWTIYRNSSYFWVGGGVQEYNREHTWPESYGFSEQELGANNIARTDMHSLMLADDGYNFGRSNKFFDNCSSSCTERATDINNGEGGGIGVYPGNSNWYDTDSYEVWEFRKGDVARAMFYMVVRYEGFAIDEVDLELTDNPAEIVVGGTKMGLLSTLLEWHILDPVDELERLRMEVIYSYQNNRNPFIDHPEWVTCVFENDCFIINDIIYKNGFNSLFYKAGDNVKNKLSRGLEN